MSKQQKKIKENKFTLLILIGILCFSIIVSLLDSISIQPSITSIYFYLLLLLIAATVYRPVRTLLVRSVKALFTSIKSLCTTAISFILHK